MLADDIIRVKELNRQQRALGEESVQALIDRHGDDIAAYARTILLACKTAGAEVIGGGFGALFVYGYLRGREDEKAGVPLTADADWPDEIHDKETDGQEV